MKKNKLFRLLTLALTLVFLCQFAVTAFAEELNYGDEEIVDSYDDTYGSGYTYFFRVEKYAGAPRVNGVRAITQRKYHTTGTPTYFYAGYYEIYSASALMNSSYSDIRTLAQSIGVKPSFSLNAYTIAIEVPAASSTGYYSLKTDFWSYSGEWEVNAYTGYGTDGLEFDYYPFAAQQTTGVLAYMYIS